VSGSSTLGNQIVSGGIDLSVEHEQGFAVFDHEAPLGAEDSRKSRSICCGPQLAHHAAALAEVRLRRSANSGHMPNHGSPFELEKVP